MFGRIRRIRRAPIMKKPKVLKITKEQLIKFWKKANRELMGEYRPTIIHKTGKKDKKRKNTIKPQEWKE